VTHRFAAKAGTVPAAVKRLRLYDALSCQAGASDNKGRSRVTIAPPNGIKCTLLLATELRLLIQSSGRTPKLFVIWSSGSVNDELPSPLDPVFC